jgi:hypothetical protein
MIPMIIDFPDPGYYVGQPHRQAYPAMIKLYQELTGVVYPAEFSIQDYIEVYKKLKKLSGPVKGSN